MAINPNASSSFIVLILALFFVVMGNFMQTIKPNYFLGMRTPWTLQSETVWKKTHKLAGVLMVLAGLLSLVAYFIIPNESMKYVLMPSLLISVIVPYIYSYLLFKNLKK